MASLLALAPTGSFALELGEAAIKSALGQSLVVEIPYRLAASEQLAPDCVALAPAGAGNRELPTYSRVSRIGLTPTHIEIFGSARVLEPLIGITVDVHCATAPHFARSYQLFVDPPTQRPAVVPTEPRLSTASTSREGAATIAATRDSAATATAAATTPRAAVTARARGQAGGALALGQTYTVVRGDTLSGIAARVSDRPATIRATADAIFAANPQAFTRGNRDLLEAGRSIEIPLMAATTDAQPSTAAPVPTAAEAAATIEVAPAPATVGEAAALPRAEAAASAVVPEAIAPPPSAVPVAGPSAPAERAPPMTTAEPSTTATSLSSSLWLTALLALGAALALSIPVLFIRRRQREAAMPDRPEPRASQPRQLVDPAAGFDVVEGRLGRTQTNEAMIPRNAVAASLVDSRAAAPEMPTLAIDPTDAVDLDVGAPVEADGRADWFDDRTDTAVTVSAPASDDTLEASRTTRMPQPESSATDSRERSIDDDEQHTLTIVEIDMLRKDYEAEHTLTQETSKALREAVADLKATQAARAAAGQTATLEMPQQPNPGGEDSSETQTLTQRRA